MATLQNIGKLKYRGKDGQWHPLPVVVQDAGGGVSTISGKGQPTESTVGRLNQLYRDESTDKLYICTGVEGGYTWAAVVSDTEDTVKYTAQTLTNPQKEQARSNIGAGTSNFSGSYNDLTNKPNIPAAPVIDTTLTKAGYAADAKAAGDAIGKKLDKTALPTAINDALAQAKASGEFDGEKGDKGDPGAPGIRGEKGETGPAGAKGADGKDGAGMDVTGATVGQIAKITAVDAQGKPTEWEPVDMPGGDGAYTLPIASPAVLGGVKPVAKTDAMTQGVGVDAEGALWTEEGGGSWEKVADVVVSEDVATVSIELSKACNDLCIMDEIPIIEGSTANDSATLRIKANGIAIFYKAGYIATYGTYTRKRSYWFSRFEMRSWMFATDANANNPVNFYNVVAGYTKTVNSLITNVSYETVLDGKVVPAGTKITIYGK